MDAELESVDWDTVTYTLNDFLDTFELPQIVCVRDGYLDLEENTTLSCDQVMVLHFVKPCKMIKGFSENERDKPISIPVSTNGTLDILPNKLPTIYKSVNAVKNDRSVKTILSLHGHAWLGIKEQDILKIEGFKRKHLKEFMRCSVVNRNGVIVDIPTSYEACFHSYEQPKTIPIREIESQCNFPCVVKINACAPTKPDYDPDDESEFLDLKTLGRIKILGVYDYNKVVSSIRYMEKVRILQVPINLEITVCTGREATNKDSKYYKLCKEVHDSTEFQQMDGLDYEYMKMGHEEDKVDNIYEYIDSRYLKPPRPPRLDMPAEASPVKPPLLPHRIPSPENSCRSQPLPTPPQQTPESPKTSPEKQHTGEETFSIPDELKDLTVEGVAMCLKYLHMDKYVEKFEEELIDGAMLVELSEDIIEESLGVSNILHKKKLKKFIDGWRPK